MLNPSNLQNGQEQHESYKDRLRKKSLVQYDYRHTNGKLFSCIKATLDDCRKAKEEWLNKNAE